MILIYIYFLIPVLGTAISPGSFFFSVKWHLETNTWVLDVLITFEILLLPGRFIALEILLLLDLPQWRAEIHTHTCFYDALSPYVSFSLSLSMYVYTCLFIYDHDYTPILPVSVSSHNGTHYNFLSLP
jgi:hypothetical protein